MASFLKANLPSDEEEDEDYIPDKKETEDDQETKEQRKEPALVTVSEAETREQKNKVEDLWKQLQQKTATKVKNKKTVSVAWNQKTVTEKQKNQTEECEQGSSGVIQHSANDVDGVKVNAGTDRRSESKKRSVSGVDALLASFQKKKKINVLDKTKTDWRGFKATHKNDAEDLSAHQKSSEQYLEKREFLDRAVQKEYEINREKKSRR